MESAYSEAVPSSENGDTQWAGLTLAVPIPTHQTVLSKDPSHISEDLQNSSAGASLPEFFLRFLVLHQSTFCPSPRPPKAYLLTWPFIYPSNFCIVKCRNLTPPQAFSVNPWCLLLIIPMSLLSWADFRKLHFFWKFDWQNQFLSSLFQLWKSSKSNTGIYED